MPRTAHFFLNPKTRASKIIIKSADAIRPHAKLGLQVLLQAIAEPTVTTIEVSEVVMALHLNHGGFKESHKKNGTEYNKQLAVYGNFGIIWDALIVTTLPALPHPTHAV